MNKLTQIRNRKSYKEFKELYNWLKCNSSKKELLEKIYELLDSHRGYGTRTKSYYAKESLEQVLIDVDKESLKQVLNIER